MNKCGNRADVSPFNGHKWIVDGIVYCSPWCERNKGKHPNSVGLFKKILDSRRKT